MKQEEKYTELGSEGENEIEPSTKVNNESSVDEEIQTKAEENKDEQKDETFKNKVWNTMKNLGYKMLWGIDFVGEVFADFLGITDSKYQYVLDAYERHVREQEEEKVEIEREERQNQKAREKMMVELEAGNITSGPESDFKEKSNEELNGSEESYP